MINSKTLDCEHSYGRYDSMKRNGMEWNDVLCQKTNQNKKVGDDG